MKGFRFRLYLISTATIALLTAAFASVYVFTEMNGYRSTLEREGKLLATILAQNARLPLFAENREALSLLAGSTARHPSILFVSISNADGKLLTEVRNRKADTGDAIEMDVPVTSPGPVMSPDAVLLGRAPVDDKRVIGHVHLSLDTSGMREQLKNLLVASPQP
jgi:hypothetical protein